MAAGGLTELILFKLLLYDYYSPVPRLSIAPRFDKKLREKSFEKQNSVKAVLFTMYVSTVWYGGREDILSTKNMSAYHNEIAHG